jgi:hypothetical protein
MQDIKYRSEVARWREELLEQAQVAYRWNTGLEMEPWTFDLSEGWLARILPTMPPLSQQLLLSWVHINPPPLPPKGLRGPMVPGDVAVEVISSTEEVAIPWLSLRVSCKQGRLDEVERAIFDKWNSTVSGAGAAEFAWFVKQEFYRAQGLAVHDEIALACTPEIPSLGERLWVFTCDTLGHAPRLAFADKARGVILRNEVAHAMWWLCSINYHMVRTTPSIRQYLINQCVDTLSTYVCGDATLLGGMVVDLFLRVHHIATDAPYF